MVLLTDNAFHYVALYWSPLKPICCEEQTLVPLADMYRLGVFRKN